MFRDTCERVVVNSATFCPHINDNCKVLRCVYSSDLEGNGERTCDLVVASHAVLDIANELEGLFKTARLAVGNALPDIASEVYDL